MARRNEKHGPPPTLGSEQNLSFNTFAECRSCGHRVVLDIPTLLAKYGAEMPFPKLSTKLVCSRCGARGPRFQVALKDPPPMP